MSNKYLDFALKEIVNHKVNEVLEKIRAEISKLQIYKLFDDTEKLVALDEVLQIIDKYRGESKDARGN